MTDSQTNEMDTPKDSSDKPLEQPKPIGYAVSNLKFSLMIVLTLGYYVIWWAYKNYRALQIPGPNKLGSVVYAVFFPISFFNLLKGVEAEAVSHDIPFRLNKLLVAVMYFLFITATKIFVRNEETVLIALITAIISLIIVFFGHREVLEVNRKIGAYIDSKLTWKDFVFIVIALVAAFTIG